MAGTIDPYLTPEDVRLISEGATERFVDAECHSPDSVLLVRGALYYVQSATAIGSVQPMAGTTSRRTRARICCLRDGSMS